MSLTTLSLPVDIPWRRLAISEDMYSVSETAALPAEWRSSCAIFSYDPTPDEQPANPDELTTFLKVIVSITGFQPAGGQVDSGALHGSYGTTVITNYDTLTSQYYPAFSALLQVAVYPESGQFSVDQYPYLTDFEPKKREVVELVTDTGEALTQSASDLNVRKGTTSTDSTENVNIDRGGSFGMNINTPYGGGGFNYSHNQDVGTTSRLGTEAVNVVTTDASREKRESYSHTTNLSQLYQVLDSYHSGTNRAIFFVNARPHIVDSPYTFANGPRKLEGIQEFFLVVRRPKAMVDFCVRAILETAHIHESDTQVTTGTTVYDQQQLSQTFPLHAGGGHFSADDTPGAWTMNIPGGYKLDRSRGGGTYHIDWGGGNVNDGAIPSGVGWSLSGTTDSGHTSEAIPVITTYDDHVDITAHVYGIQNVLHPQDANMNYTITVFTISDAPTQTPQTTTQKSIDLFLTAREVTNCPSDFIFLASPYVSYEAAVSDSARAGLQAARGVGKDAAIAANAVSREIQHAVITSFRPGKRYTRGTVSFETTHFALREIFGSPDVQRSPQLQQKLADAAPSDLKSAIGQKAPNLTVAEALKTAPETLSAGLGITLQQVHDVLTAATGLRFAGATPPAKPSPAPGRSGGTAQGKAATPVHTHTPKPGTTGGGVGHDRDREDDDDRDDDSGKRRHR